MDKRALTAAGRRLFLPEQPKPQRPAVYWLTWGVLLGAGAFGLGFLGTMGVEAAEWVVYKVLG